jgi:hypothetical protein
MSDTAPKAARAVEDLHLSCGQVITALDSMSEGGAIEGPPGPAGPAGPQGPAGPAGADLSAELAALEARVAALE